MIHDHERLPRIEAECDLIKSAARLTEGMTADEMDEMEREIAAEHAAEARNFEADRIEHEAEMYDRWEQGR